MRAEFHAIRSTRRQAEIDDESKDGARFRWLIEFQGPAIWGFGKRGRLERVRKFIDDEIRTDQADIRPPRKAALLAEPIAEAIAWMSARRDRYDSRKGGLGK